MGLQGFQVSWRNEAITLTTWIVGVTAIFQQ
jgi:hypothetical protein